MNKFLAALVIAVLILGLVNTAYNAYASKNGAKTLDDEGDKEGKPSDSGGGSTNSTDGESHNGSGEQHTGDHEEESGGEFMEKYNESVDKLNKLMAKADALNSSGYNMSSVYALLAQAQSALDAALNAYNNGDVGSAMSALENAEKLLDQVEDAIKHAVKGGHETVKSVSKMEDEEEDDYLEYSITNGNITVSSKDNKVEFSDKEPKIEFKYFNNNVSVKFEVQSFDFIEFVDRNGNGQIDDGEVLQVVSSDDLPWQSNVNKTLFDNNTEITVTYYTNTSDLELELVMHIYNYTVLENTTIGNKTLTIKVDGGADQVKYDFIVYRWPWMSNESSLALYNKIEVKVGSGASLKSITADDNAIYVDLGVVNVTVSWIKYASVDGSPVNVSTYYKSIELNAGSNGASLELKVFFIYPYFGDGILVHDPSIGLLKGLASLVQPNLITWDTLLLIALSTIMVVSIAVVLSRKGYLASLI